MLLTFVLIGPYIYFNPGIVWSVYKQLMLLAFVLIGLYILTFVLIGPYILTFVLIGPYIYFNPGIVWSVYKQTDFDMTFYIIGLFYTVRNI